MNTRTMAKRLEKLEVRYAPAPPMFIRVLFVEPGGEITGEQIFEVGGRDRRGQPARGAARQAGDAYTARR